MQADTSARARGRIAQRYDGESRASIAALVGAPEVHLYASIGSTMDVAHALGEGGAPAGTVILADAQTAGRGRQGNSWRSAPGRGIWLTILERPLDPGGVEVLSLRVGLAAARALDSFAASPVRLKWPNDLFVGRGKVAGVLVEARWRGRNADWVAVGLGVNVRPPEEIPGAAGLREGTSRIAVLVALVPALRAAAGRAGPLDPAELAEYAARDAALGRRCVAPGRGIVGGVTAIGELAVRTATGVEYHRAGSLLLEEDA